MNCAVCFANFTDPRVLVCGHSFCLLCVSGYARTIGAQAFPCPTCRAPTNIPPGGCSRLPRNYALKEALESPLNAALPNEPAPNIRMQNPSLVEYIAQTARALTEQTRSRTTPLALMIITLSFYCLAERTAPVWFLGLVISCAYQLRHIALHTNGSGPIVFIEVGILLCSSAIFTILGSAVFIIAVTAILNVCRLETLWSTMTILWTGLSKLPLEIGEMAGVLMEAMGRLGQIVYGNSSMIGENLWDFLIFVIENSNPLVKIIFRILRACFVVSTELMYGAGMISAQGIYHLLLETPTIMKALLEVSLYMIHLLWVIAAEFTSYIPSFMHFLFVAMVYILGHLVTLISTILSFMAQIFQSLMVVWKFVASIVEVTKTLFVALLFSAVILRHN